MKAPLRFVFGWVLYLGLFMAINPIIIYVIALFGENIVAGVITATLALVVLIVMFFNFLQPFWRWADKPRAPAHR